MSILRIYGTIGVDVTPASIARELESSNEPVTVYINSFGGDAYAGIAIANQLSAYQAKVTAIVEGIAASAASIILTGADTVQMYRSAEIMVHEASVNIGGNSAELAASSAQLNQLSESIAHAYADRAGTAATTWREAMKAETWFNAEDAVAAGLADQIINGKAAKKPEAALTRVKIRPPAALLTKEKKMPTTPETPEGSLVLTPEHVDKIKTALQVEEIDADTLVETVETMAKNAGIASDPADPNPQNVLTSAIAEAKAEARAQALTHTWIEEGRFSAALRDKVIRLATVDPDLARESFGSRPKNSVPMRELGHARYSDDVPGTGAKWVR